MEIFQKHSHELDIVIPDVMMPGLSGRDTLHGLRKIDEHVRVLLSSGYSIEGEAQEILAAGALGFVQKPYKIDELSQKIEGALKVCFA